MGLKEKKVSVLIPYKENNDKHREFLWSIVKMRYEILMPDVEICLGVDTSQIYNRSKAVNKAARKANGDIFIITDADVVFSKDLIRKITDAIEEYPWVVPFTRGMKLNKTATERLLMDGIPEEIHAQETDADCVITTAGPLMNAVSRENFEKIRGMDERFKGWGGEDDAMRISLDTLCGSHYRITGDILHLWHPPAVVYRDYYIDNIHLLKRYMEASGNIGLMQSIINEKEIMT
ncbi:MAG: glycosyltransferase [Clostridia bacterium]|nr:glycosyltransferase [Clostridia bacterium]